MRPLLALIVFGISFAPAALADLSASDAEKSYTEGLTFKSAPVLGDEYLSCANYWSAWTEQIDWDEKTRIFSDTLPSSLHFQQASATTDHWLTLAAAKKAITFSEALDLLYVDTAEKRAVETLMDEAMVKGKEGSVETLFWMLGWCGDRTS